MDLLEHDLKDMEADNKRITQLANSITRLRDAMRDATQLIFQTNCKINSGENFHTYSAQNSQQLSRLRAFLIDVLNNDIEEFRQLVTRYNKRDHPEVLELLDVPCPTNFRMGETLKDDDGEGIF